MPSSPADPTTSLTHLVEAYDLVFEALGRDDLDRVATLLDRTQSLLDELEGLATASGDVGEDIGRAAAEARASQGRALAGLQEALERAGTELSKVRGGRKALKGYGNRAESVGRRIRCDI